LGGLIFSTEPYLIEIGDNTAISGSVVFETHDGGVCFINDREHDLLGCYGRIKIGKNCFIGERSIIMPDIEIGDNCLVAAGSVVVSSMPPNSVILGNPAKVVSNIAFYKKAKLMSKSTVRFPDFARPCEHRMTKEGGGVIDSPECFIPDESRISKAEKKKLLLDHFSKIPIRKARRRNR